MNDLISFLLKNILGHEEFEIKEEVNSYDQPVLRAAIKQEDMGRVIGKQGKIINAIRDLFRVRNTKESRQMNFELKEVSTVS